MARRRSPEDEPRLSGYNHETRVVYVQDGGLSGGVKTDHQDSHLLATPKSIKQPRESDTHVGGASKPGGTVRLEKGKNRREGERKEARSGVEVWGLRGVGGEERSDGGAVSYQVRSRWFREG